MSFKTGLDHSTSLRLRAAPPHWVNVNVRVKFAVHVFLCPTPLHATILTVNLTMTRLREYMYSDVCYLLLLAGDRKRRAMEDLPLTGAAGRAPGGAKKARCSRE